jgi:hypothetical protein
MTSSMSLTVALRLDMDELEQCWLIGQRLQHQGVTLDPMHDAMAYAAMVMLGMHGLERLAAALSRQ